MSPEPLAVELIEALGAARQSLATAESLTGGLIGGAITAVPGASASYLGGVVSYATRLKNELAGVPLSVLDAWGPVAEATAAAMAAGVRARVGADWGLAVTGVAGPDPQDGHRPGEVWIGIARPDGSSAASRIDLDGSREQIRTATVRAALARLLQDVVAISSQG